MVYLHFAYRESAEFAKTFDLRARLQIWRQGTMVIDHNLDVSWRRSTRSGPGSNNCVEMAIYGEQVLIRDSKDPKVGTLAFNAAAWMTFIDALRRGTIHCRRRV